MGFLSMENSSKKKASDFRAEYEKRFGNNYKPEKPFQYSIDPNVNLSRLLLPLAPQYIRNWCTYNESDQCTDRQMRSFLHEPYRKIFQDVWDAIHIHVPDGMMLNAMNVRIVATDLKNLYEGLK